jgi:hypothetical protein
MIVSVHIPKTGGTSFRHMLQAHFGPRLLLDYGDWPELDTPEAQAHHRRRRDEMMGRLGAISTDYDVVHGHFAATKYSDLFSTIRMLCFVRDPYQHAMSAHDYGKRSAASSVPTDHPGIRQFRDMRMTLLDMIETHPNLQSRYLRNVSLDDFAMIGLTEYFEESIKLFRAIFGIDLGATIARENINPDREGAAHQVAPEVREAIDRHCCEDIDLYRGAKERFLYLMKRYEP